MRRLVTYLVTYLVTALVAALAPAGAAAAQDATHLNLEEALERATSALTGNTFGFSYTLWTAQDPVHPLLGAGEADLSRHHWRYTVTSAANPEDTVHWVIIDTTWYHDAGDGWRSDGLDFSYAGVTGMIQPFASYAQMKALADGESDRLVDVYYLGGEILDGIYAQGFAFGTRAMPLFGSADYEMWLSEGSTGFERILLIVTPVGGNTSRMAFTRIGEPVSIEPPL